MNSRQKVLLKNGRQINRKCEITWERLISQVVLKGDFVLWLTIWKLEHNSVKIEVKGQKFWSRIKTIFFYLQ